MAGGAPLAHVELRTFLGGSAPRREFLSGRTDSNIPGAHFFRGRGPSQMIGGRLSPPRAPQDRHRKEESRRNSHCEHSHRWRSSTVESYCRHLSDGIPGSTAHSSIWRLRLVSVEPCPVRPCRAT